VPQRLFIDYADTSFCALQFILNNIADEAKSTIMLAKQQTKAILQNVDEKKGNLNYNV
jgi:hypothetical protein